MTAWFRITLWISLVLILPFILLVTVARIIGESVETQIIAVNLMPTNTVPGITSLDEKARLQLIDLNQRLDLQIQLSRQSVIDIYPLDDPGEVLLLSNTTDIYDSSNMSDIILEHLDLDDGGITPFVFLTDLENYVGILQFIYGNYRILSIKNDILGLNFAKASRSSIYTYDMKAHRVLGQFALGNVAVFYPHWSPDNRHIAMMVQGKLLIYPIDGETVQEIDIGYPFDDAAWSDDGTQILLSAKYSNLIDTVLPLTIVDFPAGEVNESLPQPLANNAQWICERVLYTSAERDHLRLLGSDQYDPLLDQISVLAFYPSSDCEWVLFTSRSMSYDGALAPVSRLNLYVADADLQHVRQITDAGITAEDLANEDGFFYRATNDSGGESLFYESWNGTEGHIAVMNLPNPSFRLVSINEFGLVYMSRSANFTNALIQRDIETGEERYLTDPNYHVMYFAVW